MQLVSSLVSSLAWPLVALAALVLFGREIKRWLADRPSKVKVGPVEAEWERQVAKVETNLDQPEIVRSATRQVESAAGGSLAESLAGTAESAPLVAITEAAQAVEAALVTKLTEKGVQAPSGLGMAGLARLGLQNGVLTRDAADSIAGLSVMRGLAVHSDRSIDAEKAREFVALADAIVYFVGRA